MHKRIALLAFGISTIAHASSGNYICSGKDLGGNAIRIQVKNELPRTAYRDLKIARNNRAPITYRHIDAHSGVPSFDVGLSTRDFSLWIHQPPNMLGTNEIAASYFAGPQADLGKRVILSCR